MKIAVMTWFSFMNYGTFLQATALCEKLKSLGNKVQLIQYYPREKEPLLPDKNIISEFLGKAIRKIKNRGVRSIVSEKNGHIFKSYSAKYFDLTDKCETLCDLEKLNEVFDAFVCGSDQVWSPLVFDSHYFLDFVKNPHKKIAYAPSMGVSRIKVQEIENEIRKLTENFGNISVREESGSEILSAMKGEKVPVTLDPTLLLDKKDWADLFEIKETNEKYLLAYFLGNNEKHWKKTESLARKLNLEIKIIPVFEKDLSRKGVVHSVGPEEFVSLFYNASYVCTDSFHGVAFSVNFSKDFTCFERFRKGDKENQNTRIYNILNKLNLNDRLNCLDEKREINKNQVEEKLNDLRKSSEEFLRSSLEKAENAEEIFSKNHIFENNSLCAGCGVCKEICPCNAIEIAKNNNGFYEAQVNENTCVSCGKCKTVCPMQNGKNSEGIGIGTLYSYKDNDPEVLVNSSSGAVAYRISKYLSQKGYSVAGCIFDVNEQKAKHVLASCEDEEILKKFRGSKYMQSDFSAVLKDLRECRTPVAVFGTPCQIAGARNLLGDRADVIYIDLICHGVPSYNLYEKYKTVLKEKHGFTSENNDVTFRHKQMGWRERYMRVSDGEKEIIEHKNENEYFLMFESKNCYSPACYECRYRSGCSADIRIGDYWGEKFIQDTTGVSMVLAMNAKGESLFEEIKPFGKSAEENISDYFHSQQTENISRSVYYNDVLRMLRTKETRLEEIVEKYITPFEKRKQVKNKIYEIVKKIIR